MVQFTIRFLILIVLLILFPGPPVYGEDEGFSEYEVKAGFIFNFIKFIEWPNESPSETKPITVCIVGSDPFDQHAESINNKTVRGRKLEVKRLGHFSEAKNCAILFISGSEKENVPRMLDSLKNVSVLTIGDTKGYGQQGVMINFTMEQNKVRFEINLEKTRQAKFIVSSKLLRLAKTIN